MKYWANPHAARQLQFDCDRVDDRYEWVSSSRDGHQNGAVEPVYSPADAGVTREAGLGNIFAPAKDSKTKEIRGNGYLFLIVI